MNWEKFYLLIFISIVLMCLSLGIFNYGLFQQRFDVMFVGIGLAILAVIGALEARRMVTNHE